MTCEQLLSENTGFQLICSSYMTELFLRLKVESDSKKGVQSRTQDSSSEQQTFLKNIPPVRQVGIKSKDINNKTTKNKKQKKQKHPNNNKKRARTFYWSQYLGLELSLLRQRIHNQFWEWEGQSKNVLRRRMLRVLSQKNVDLSYF